MIKLNVGSHVRFNLNECDRKEHPAFASAYNGRIGKVIAFLKDPEHVIVEIHTNRGFLKERETEHLFVDSAWLSHAKEKPE